MNEVTKHLCREARKNGICTPWLNKLGTLDSKDDMVDMYVRGLDFCLSNDYPSNEFIRKHFKGVMEKHGVYLDDAIELTNPPKLIALGATSGKVTATEYSVVEVWAKHHSNIVVEARGHAFVMVDVYDNAVVNVTADESAKVCINRHGGSITRNVTGDAAIKVRNKAV